MRQGIFPGRVNDPVTRNAYPNNTIPVSQWDPVAAKLLPLYPSRTFPARYGTSTTIRKRSSAPTRTTCASITRSAPRDSIFGRISQTWNNNRLPTVMPEPANQPGHTDLKARQLMISETHTLSPNKVNEFRLGFVYTSENQDLFGPRLFDEFGIKGALEAPRITGLPQFSITGLSTLGTAAPGPAPIPAREAATSHWKRRERSGSFWITSPGSAAVTPSNSAWTSNG